jgi:hypothetical protein
MGTGFSQYVPCLERHADVNVRIEYDANCAFLDKVDHVVGLLKKRSDKKWLDEAKYIKVSTHTQGVAKDKLVVYVDEEIIYSKDLVVANPRNPQPRPSEIGEIVETIFPEYPITRDESASIFKVHSESFKEKRNIEL